MNAKIMKKGICLIGFILIFLAGLLAVNDFNSDENGSYVVSIKSASTFNDSFSEGILNSQKWQITREGDSKENIIDVYDVDPSDNFDPRLRLGMNTIGTSDNTVKFQGVKSVEKVNFSDGKEISFDLYWNNQSNGCYLTGAFCLCPTATNGNPEDESNWIKFEYIGVPPGENGRSIISSKIDGNIRLLYDEGWPEERTGRKIADQHIKIILYDKSFKILENGKELYTSSLHNLNFKSAYIYLQMSSHSNYPMREIYFDNIIVARCA